MATRARQSRWRFRWLPPLVGVALLSIGWAAVAVVVARHYGASSLWAARITAELSRLNRASAPVPVAPEHVATTATTTVATPEPRAAVSGPAATSMAPPLAADANPSVVTEFGAAWEQSPPLEYPRLIVLYVLPATDAADGQAGVVPRASAAPASAAPASAAPVSAAPARAAAVASAASAPQASAPASAAPAPVPCGATQCEPGMVCCNASCGTCVHPGERCSQHNCGQPVPAESATCGPNTCNVDEVCCNESCGICVHPGDPCDSQRRCSDQITYGESQSCGMHTCNVGLVCCNPSCGTCVRPGESCSQRVCK